MFDTNSSNFTILQIRQIITFCSNSSDYNICKEMKLRCFLAAQTWMSTGDLLVSGISKLALVFFVL